MEILKLTENMVAVLKVLADMPEGKAFARQVLAKMEGKTFNGVNATLAAAAGKGLVAKARKINEAEEKILTEYAILPAGLEAIAPEEEKEEDAE